MKQLLLSCISFYQKIVSPTLHSTLGVQTACRFSPTCSEYMYQAVSHHGILTGLKLSLVRIAKCHPFHEGGTDPVPKHI